MPKRGAVLTSRADTLCTIMFETSSSKVVIERRVYTMLDWMFEVGGFVGFVALIAELML